jgi:hypothetical protein
MPRSENMKLKLYLAPGVESQTTSSQSCFLSLLTLDLATSDSEWPPYSILRIACASPCYLDGWLVVLDADCFVDFRVLLVITSST